MLIKIGETQWIKAKKINEALQILYCLAATINSKSK